MSNTIKLPPYLNASYEGDDLFTGDQVRELLAKQEPDDLMIAYMSGLHDGKKLAKQEQGEQINSTTSMSLTSQNGANYKQEQDEPVAWMQSDEVHISLWKDDYHTIPLYTTQQRTWVGLTDEQIMDMYNEPRSDAEMIAFGREVEAKLKEKNT